MLEYENIVVQLSGENGSGIVPAFRASLSQSASLQARKTLSTDDMFEEWGISGPQEFSLSMDFPVLLGVPFDFYNGFRYLDQHTGEQKLHVSVGETTFYPCYLEGLSLSIAPNSLIMGNASIKMFKDGGKTMPPTGSPYIITNLHDKVCYGHNVETGDLNSRSDKYISNVTYSVKCQRSYSFPIYSSANSSDDRVVSFLDSVDKELTIQNRDVSDTLPSSGYSGGFYVDISGGNESIRIGVSGNSVIRSIEHSHEVGRNATSSLSFLQNVF